MYDVCFNSILSCYRPHVPAYAHLGLGTDSLSALEKKDPGIASLHLQIRRTVIFCGSGLLFHHPFFSVLYVHALGRCVAQLTALEVVDGSATCRHLIYRDQTCSSPRSRGMCPSSRREHRVSHPPCCRRSVHCIQEELRLHRQTSSTKCSLPPYISQVL